MTLVTSQPNPSKPMSLPATLESKLEQLISILGAERCGQEWACRCPLHGDTEPSLNFRIKGGKIVFFCQACREGFDYKACIDAFPPEAQRLLKGRSENNLRVHHTALPVATYKYRWKGYSFDKLRFPSRPNGKKVMVYRHFVDGVEVREKPKVPVFLYEQEKLDRLQDVPVLIPEGEKDANSCNERLGDDYVAVTNDNGGPSWSDEHSKLIAGRDIIILQDNDEAGRLRTQKIIKFGRYRKLLGVIVFEDAPKMDVTDWLQAGHSTEELREKLINGLATPEPIIERPRLTDTGNADRFIELHSNNAKYCEEISSWVVWNGTHWEKNNGKPIILAKDVAKELFKEAAETKSDNSKELAKWGIQSESSQKIKSMLFLAQPDPRMALDIEELDHDRYLLNVANGTLALGENVTLKPHTPDDFITKLLPIEYDNEASWETLAPNFSEFLTTIFKGNRDLIAFVQRALGYSISGDVGERKIFILWGAGKNGKSTLVHAIASVLGKDYAQRIPTEILEVKRNDRIPNDIAALKGIRFAYCSETKEGKQLDEAMVKDISGGETLSARFMRGEFFNFDPQFKVWLSTNPKPVIKGTDDAIWDRICLIPFEHRFSEEDIILNFSDVLKSESHGILKFLVEGFMQWRRIGLAPPAIVNSAVLEYRNESNVIKSFIEECLEDKRSSDPVPTVKCSAVREAYSKYTGDNHITPQKFSKMFEKHTGLTAITKGGGMKYWEGYQLITDEDNSYYGQ